MTKPWFFTLVLIALAGSIASANPIILAPSATTLTTGQVRAEAALSSGNEHGRYYWLTTGVQQYELSAIGFQRRSEKVEGMFSIQQCFLPETMLSPAVAFGISDMASQSPDGVGLYAVVTRHLPIGQASFLIRDFAATAGVGVLGIKGPFCGFEAKLPGNFFIQGEYDSHDTNAAIGWQPINLFRVKAYSIQSDIYFGAELMPMTF